MWSERPLVVNILKIGAAHDGCPDKKVFKGKKEILRAVEKRRKSQRKEG